MNKAILISIRSEHVINILNGTKTLELRNSVPKDFKGWVYIYCTKGKDILEYSFLGYRTLRESSFYNYGIGIPLNGKVVARFWFDKTTVIKDYLTIDNIFQHYLVNDLKKDLCLTQDEIDYYGKGKDLYAWHIKKLEIFDKPLMLSDFYKTNIPYTGIREIEYALDYYGKEKVDNILKYSLKRAPQSWQYVYIKE